MRNCEICGKPESARNRVEAAHLNDKGMGGLGSKAAPERDDTAFLCAGTGGNTDPRSCHGANEAGALALRRNSDGTLGYCVVAHMLSDDRVAERIAKRLKVHRGSWHVALYTDTDFDAVDEPRTPEPEPTPEPTDDDFLSAVVVKFREATTIQSTAHYFRCAILAETRAHFIERHGEREGAALFREFRSEQMEVKFAVEASRMLTIGTFLADVPEAVHSLTGDQLYDLARVLKRGDEREAAIADALAMSGYDFKAARFPKDDKPERERITCPMGLSCSHVKEEA